MLINATLWERLALAMVSKIKLQFLQVLLKH